MSDDEELVSVSDDNMPTPTASAEVVAVDDAPVEGFDAPVEPDDESVAPDDSDADGDDPAETQPETQPATQPATGRASILATLRALPERAKALDREVIVEAARRTSIATRAAAGLGVVSLLAGGVAWKTSTGATAREGAMQARIVSLSSDIHELQVRLAHERARVSDAVRANGHTESRTAEPEAVVPFAEATIADLSALAPGLRRSEIDTCIQPTAAKADALGASLATATPNSQVRTIVEWLRRARGAALAAMPTVTVVSAVTVAPQAGPVDFPEFARLEFAPARAARRGNEITVAGTDSQSPLPIETLLDVVRVLSAPADSEAAPEQSSPAAADDADHVDDADARLALNAIRAAAVDHAALAFAFAGYLRPAAIAAAARRTSPEPGAAVELRRAALRYLCGEIGANARTGIELALQEPPRTTLALLEPALPPDVIEPRAPRALDAPWRTTTSATLGAGHLLALLAAPGGTAAPLPRWKSRARSWAGGVLTRWSNGTESAQSIAFTADLSQRPSLCASVLAWYGAAFPTEYITNARDGLVGQGDGHAGVVRCSGDQVRVGLANDVRLAAALTR